MMIQQRFCKRLLQRIHTLSDDRHPAGRHTVIDGMMEVFGDRIAKISQIDRRAWTGESPLSNVVVVVIVVAATRSSGFRAKCSPYNVSTTNIRFARDDVKGLYASRVSIATVVYLESQAIIYIVTASLLQDWGGKPGMRHSHEKLYHAVHATNHLQLCPELFTAHSYIPPLQSSIHPNPESTAHGAYTL